MASDQSFVDYICEQADLPGRLSFRKMFGEYALYLDGKVIALVCDNLLFVKPTPEGKAILGQTTDAPPYPGARLHFQVGDEIDDRQRLRHLFEATFMALPMPKPKKSKAIKAKPTPKRTTRRTP
jgi:TfoX/Sxy family transcriptional regulator of competence genes